MPVQGFQTEAYFLENEEREGGAIKFGNGVTTHLSSKERQYGQENSYYTIQGY